MTLLKLQGLKRLWQAERFWKSVFRMLKSAFLRKEKCLAGNFAAKEAVSKAMGTGFRGFSIKEIEVLRNELEAPFVVLNGMALNVAEKRKIKNIKISISHCGEYAMAFAVAEGDETHEGC